MSNTDNLIVVGDRVLVEKEQIESSGLKLTPALEEGQKNKGKVIKIGQINKKFRKLGIKEGKIIYFKRFFSANHDSNTKPLVFVDCEEILAIN